MKNRKSCPHRSRSMVLEVPGTQKPMKNLSKIDAKSMLEKGMQKSQKMKLKWTKNGSQIGPKSRKSQKKGMPKTMLKFEAEKNLKNCFLTNPGSPRVRFFGRSGRGRGGQVITMLADLLRFHTLATLARVRRILFAPKSTLGRPRVDC